MRLQVLRPSKSAASRDARACVTASPQARALALQSMLLREALSWRPWAHCHHHPAAPPPVAMALAAHFGRARPQAAYSSLSLLVPIALRAPAAAWVCSAASKTLQRAVRGAYSVTAAAVVSMATMLLLSETLLQACLRALSMPAVLTGTARRMQAVPALAATCRRRALRRLGPPQRHHP